MLKVKCLTRAGYTQLEIKFVRYAHVYSDIT